MLKNYHIVVAAGSGSRYGGAVPKQFCLLHGRPVLMTTLCRLHEAAPEADIILVLSASMIEAWGAMCRDHGFSLPHRVVAGGSTRAGSVRAALGLVDASTVGWVSVHDGARPVVGAPLVARLLEALPGADGVIPAVAVTDSLREVGPGGSSRGVDRARFRAVQTPQIFDGRKLLEANRLPLRPEFTDDASVMEAAGFTDLRLVEGDVDNIKITHSGDIDRIERYGRLS